MPVRSQNYHTSVSYPGLYNTQKSTELDQTDSYNVTAVVSSNKVTDTLTNFETLNLLTYLLTNMYRTVATVLALVRFSSSIRT